MERSRFIRRKGEKAQLVARPNIDLTKLFGDRRRVSVDESVEHLRHGDLIYDPEGYRGATTLVVVEMRSRHSENINSTTKMIERANTDVVECCSSGYAGVGTTVISAIEDPVNFYSNAMDDMLYQGLTQVDLDPAIHQERIEEITEGLRIKKDFVVSFSAHSGYEIFPRSDEGKEIYERLGGYEPSARASVVDVSPFLREEFLA